MRPKGFSVGTDFVNAKVRGMRSKLFEGERVRTLASARHLPELFRQVRPLAGFAGHLEFERMLAGDFVRDLDRVLRYLDGAMFALFEWLIVRQQLENIKVALRFYGAGGSPAAAAALICPMPSWLALPLDKLLAAPDLRRFAAALPVPELAAALARWLDSPRRLDGFTLEMVLDSAYLRKLRRLALTAKGWTRRLVAFDVDAQNLLLLLRAKFNYSFAFDDVHEFLTPSGVYLSAEAASAVYAAADWAGAIRAIPAGCLPAADREGASALAQIEDGLALRQYRLAVRCFVESVLDLAVVTGYYYIKRTELANLVRLTEGIRQGLPREEVEARLLLAHR
jgi:vacuolar-type H+-ATPase subunit C/Vma6